jgi:hypothetical protein
MRTQASARRGGEDGMDFVAVGAQVIVFVCQGGLVTYCTLQLQCAMDDT